MNSRKFLLYFFIIFFLITRPLVSFGETFSNDYDSNVRISLSIVPDKKIIRVGGHISLEHIIKNDSPINIYIIPWGGIYSTSWISFFREKNKKLPSLKQIVFSKKNIPDKTDFILLSPGESFSTTISGNVVTKKEVNIETGLSFDGLFIDFDDSSIFLNKEGIFFVQGFFRIIEELKAEGENRYNLKNIWVGSVESNIVKILIKQ